MSPVCDGAAKIGNDGSPLVGAGAGGLDVIVVPVGGGGLDVIVVPVGGGGLDVMLVPLGAEGIFGSFD